MPNSMVKPSDPTITNLTASLRKKPVRSASSLAARSRALNPIRRTMLNFQESSKFRIGQTGAGEKQAAIDFQIPTRDFWPQLQRRCAI
jgi:hypothetical protein